MGMMTMGTRLAVVCLCFLVYSCVVDGLYVPESGTLAPVKVVPVCPEDCVCMSQNTTSCVVKHDKYFLDKVLPWRLTRLRIYGDMQDEVNYITSKNLGANPSLKSVIHKHDVSLLNEEIEYVFKDMIELHVNYVPFEQLTSADLPYLGNLTVLDVAYNGIKILHSEAFSRLQKVSVLNLENNRISHIPQGLFSGLKSLRTLNLNGNDLQTLPSDVFTELPELENLYLQNNRIIRIGNFIQNLPTLAMFNIQNNRLSYILPDSVEKLTTFTEVVVSGNPFQCSCVISSLKMAMKTHPSVFQSDLLCDGPASVKGQRLQDTSDDLECKPAEIMSVSAPPYGLYQGDVTLSCSVTGLAPFGLYWITPWGDKFALPDTRLMFPTETTGALDDKEYSGINLILTSHVEMLKNGSLQIHRIRGYLSGSFTCVTVSMVGESTNKTVSIHTASKIRSTYMTSLIIGAICAFSALIMAVFIGTVRFVVSRCMHSKGCKCCCCQSDEYDVQDKYKIEDVQTIEITYEGEDSPCLDTDHNSDYEPDSSPPTVPVNSPILRKSPEKCHTPSVVDPESEEYDKNSMHIWGQLDEVRDRLRCGAEKKIEKVRSHVRSITDSGSLKIRNIKDASTLKIQSIKETGSHAASKVKKNVASGMETVKYGVQSIKEFCGTGDMGTGTVSMMSVSTDVDTKEQFRIVKSHTFV